ncbi:A/G-specific adenine glycosylase [Brachybacterium huguangmaarense]
MPSPSPSPSPAPGGPAGPRDAGAPLDDAAVSAVLDWYDAAARDLPWRAADATPWGILVSEIMLQQTPVVRVLPRWLAWMQRWPTPAGLAAAPTADVLRAWDSLGYPRRALRLIECARAITERFDGRVPDDETELRSLPGIGEYTAAAVGAFAHGRRTVVADTNIRRVLARAVAGRAHPAPSYTAAERALVGASVPHDTPRSVRWNQAVMELGALVCTARAPRCDACPLAAHGCAYLAAGRPEQPEAARRVQPFQGTDRQMRGMIMARLRAGNGAARSELAALDEQDPSRVERCLASLMADGLAVEREGTVSLP